MATLETIRKLTVQAQSQGFPELAANLNKVADAGGDVAQAMGLLGTVTDTSAKKVLSTTSTFEKHERALVGVAKETYELARAQKAAADFVGQSQNEEDRLHRVARATALVEAAVNKTSIARQQAAEASAREAEAVRNTAAEQARVAAAMDEYAKRAQRRTDEQIAHEQRLAQVRHEAASRAFGQSVDDATGVSRPSAVSQGAGFSALAEREKNTQKQLADEANRVVTALKAEENEFRRLGSVANEVNARFDALAFSTAAIEKKIKDVQAAGAKGLISNPVAQERAITQLKTDLQTIERNFGGDKIANTTKLASHQLANLSFQINDIATGLLSGQSPFTIMVQQGGQLYQILAGAEGGVVAGLKAAASWLGNMFTIGRVAFGGVIAGAGAAAYAISRYGDSQREVAIGLSGIGRASGATVESINNIAESSAAAGKVSVATSREMATAYAATGKIGSAEFGRLIKITKDYAASTGKDIPEATKELAASMANPAKGAVELAQKFGVLNAVQIHNIETLVAQNRFAEARQRIIEALPAGLIRAEDATGRWAKMWDAVSRSASNALDVIGKTIDKGLEPPKPKQPVPEPSRPLIEVPLLSRAADAFRDLGEAGRPVRASKRFTDDPDAKATLAEMQRVEQEVTQASLRARESIKQIVPDLGAFDVLTGKIADITQALNAGAVPAASAHRTLAALAAVASDYGSAANELTMQERKKQATFEASIAVQKANTDEERAAAAQMMVSAQAIGDFNARLSETNDRLRARAGVVAAAEDANNKQIISMKAQQDVLRAEINAYGMAFDKRAAYVAQETAIAQLKAQGRDLSTASSQAIIKEAAATARLNAELQKRANLEQLRIQSANAIQSAEADLRSVGAPIAERNRIQAEAAIANQARSNPGQGAAAAQEFADATRAVAQLRTAAEEAAAGLGILRSQSAELASTQLQLDEAMGRISRSDAIREAEYAKANQAIQNAGLQGTVFAERIRQNADALAEMKVELDRVKSGLGRFSFELEKGAIASGVQASLGKPLDLGPVAVRDVVQEAIAKEYNNLGTWQTRLSAGAMIGIRSKASTQFIPNAEGYAYKAQQAEQAQQEAMAAREEAARPAIEAMEKQLELMRNPVGSSLFGALESAIDSMSNNVSNAVADGQVTAANASKSDPRLDPYMSRNASIYYGTESDTFFKEITWQEAQTAQLTNISGTADQQLDVSNAQLTTLQSVLASVQSQTQGLTEMPASLAVKLSQEIATALQAAGMTKEAQEVMIQGQIMALESQISGAKIAATSGGATAVPLASGPLKQINLRANATGSDFFLPGSGGEQPYMISGIPGERVSIGRGGRGNAQVVNMVVHVHGVPSVERVPEAVRGLVSSATQTAQNRAMMRSGT
jgi:hypothetical protein